jgi:UPF0755 protein
MRFLLKAVRFCCLLLLPFLILGAFVFAYVRLPYDNQAREVRFRVEKGTTFREISRGLAREKLLRFPDLFSLLARLQHRDQNVRAGEYQFDSSWTPEKILDALCRGRVVLRKVTIPEGYTVKQISVLLGRAGLADPLDVVRLGKDPEFLGELGLEGESVEGYLFPDTYHFAEGVPVREILKAMVERFRDIYEPEISQGQKAMGLTVLEVVTMASIVEKESGRGDEKPLVASVIHNRMAKRMPLQCDPTVIYGIKDFDGNLTRRHLRTPNPYNTYIHLGLPPGPIANPGLEALRAVVEPEKTSYLYFVSKNDGTHHFSSSLREHNRAVRRYQKRRR